MQVKNYTTINTQDLSAMQAAAAEINDEITLAHSSRKALEKLNNAKTAYVAANAFKAIVKRYYGKMANQWLDENGYQALPSEFDEWDDIAGAAKAHVMQLAGIEVHLHNGWASTDTFLS